MCNSQSESVGPTQCFTSFLQIEGNSNLFIPYPAGKHVILLGHKTGRSLRPQTPAFFFVLMRIDGRARINDPTSEATQS
jgi:hypothetical protein